jgi:pimeloyl-ACP methyl ester carboxylesterase
LAATIEAFTKALNMNRYAFYVFDYGAPTGFRLAMAHPDRVTAIISQNGNAYFNVSDLVLSKSSFQRRKGPECAGDCRHVGGRTELYGSSSDRRSSKRPARRIRLPNLSQYRSVPVKPAPTSHLGMRNAQ